MSIFKPSEFDPWMYWNKAQNIPFLGSESVTIADFLVQTHFLEGYIRSSSPSGRMLPMLYKEPSRTLGTSLRVRILH